MPTSLQSNDTAKGTRRAALNSSAKDLRLPIPSSTEDSPGRLPDNKPVEQDDHGPASRSTEPDFRRGLHAKYPIRPLGIPNRFDSPGPVFAAPPGSSLCAADRSSRGPPPADPGGSSCASGTRSLRREGIARLDLWMRYYVVGAAALAPRSSLNDLITLQNRWSGAGSNRRPSAFQDYGSQCRAVHDSLPASSSTCGTRRWPPVYLDV